MPSHFPSVDRNHLVSNASKDAFSLKRPSTWECDVRDGDNDFGIDLEIQVAPQGQVCHTFRAQLKGTESPAISADGTTLNIELRRTTLNYYANMLEPVMLVVAVVTLADNGKVDLSSSKVYWQWMAEELRRLRGSSMVIDESSQGKVTLHVPLGNELTPNLDVVPYLKKRIDEARALENLTMLVRNAVEAMSGPLDDPIQTLLSVVKSNPGKLHSLLSLDDVDRVDSQVSGPMSVIAEGVAHLRAGKTALAEALVRGLDRASCEATPKLKASLTSLEGKIAVQRGRRDEALRLFETAYSLDPDEKHLLAQEELRFLDAVDRDDRQAISAITAALSGVRTDEGLGLLVRAQVSLGDFIAASQSIERITAEKRAFPTLVLLSGQKKWTEVQEAADGALLQPDLPLQDSVAIHLVAARACWQLALSSASLSPDDLEIPLQGVPGLDIEAARAAWRHAEACLRGLKDLGWPPNVELLVPVAAACAGAIGRQKDALRFLVEAAAERHEYPQLQENLELLAVTLGDHETALAANARLPQAHNVVARRACLLFQAKRYAECIEAAREVAKGLDSPCRHSPMALAMGSAAAKKLARTEEAGQLTKALNSNPAWGEFAHFATFVQLSLAKSDKDAPLEALRKGVREFPNSRFLASNLYSNLRVDDAPAATEAVGLSRVLRQWAALTLDESMHLIAAYVTLENWQDAEAEARGAIARFGEVDALVSMLAVAVELQGKTGEALALLEQVVSRGQRKSTTLRNYLGLCLRLGRVDAARDTVEKLLAVEGDRAERLELLRLDALILAQQGMNDEAFGVAKELGRLVDPEIELEEGMYLNLYMAVTLNRETLLEDEKQAFWKRVETFCDRWPESRLFRRMTMPEQGLTSIDDLHNLLDGIIGDSREKLREYEQRERQAREGSLPVPFVVRPNFVFHYIGDCFTLWDVAKRSRAEDQQYHLASTLIDETRTTDRVLRDKPLLDLTAMLVLHDLDLFETLFTLFPSIAIPRRTIDYISQNARGVLVNSRVANIAGALLGIINRNIERIDQPSSDVRAVKAVQLREMFDDYVRLAQTGRWAPYTDDAITRAWIREERADLIHLSTVDLLTLADQQGVQTPVEVASCLSKLAAWNVAITVGSRYLLAALDGALDGSRNLSGAARLDRFYAHAPFATLARAIWFPNKKPADLIGHMGAIVADMLISEQTEQESAAAVWAFWYFRVNMTPDCNATAWTPLCLSLLTALTRLPIGAAPRAVGAFMKVVEIVIGPDRMTRSKQSAVISQLGKSVGTLAKRDSALGESLRSRVAMALAPGTVEGDTFNDAYLAAQQEARQGAQTAS